MSTTIRAMQAIEFAFGIRAGHRVNLEISGCAILDWALPSYHSLIVLLNWNAHRIPISTCTPYVELAAGAEDTFTHEKSDNIWIRELPWLVHAGFNLANPQFDRRILVENQLNTQPVVRGTCSCY